jgi:S1-C subfamily serine protease
MLDFWSPQCGPCMQMKPTVHSLIEANYPIREVDTTREFQLSQQYNVHSIPCFVMLVDGQEVAREVGATSSERLQAMFQQAKDVVMQRRKGTPQPTEPELPGRVRLQNDDNPGNISRGPGGMPAPSLNGSATPSQYASNQTTFPAPRAPEQNPGGANNGSTSDFPPALLAATVRIRVEDAGGRSFGTGTIIDSRSGEALIVTCGHLFRESKGKGPMTVEIFDVTPAGPKVAEQVTGQLISYDLDRDVAFVSIRPTHKVSVATVAPSRTPIQRGDRVATIGCSNGSDPTLLPQKVNQLDRYQGPANIEVSGAPEEGRSGGGLFNLQGQLIGVCYAADYEGKEGLYSALESIHSELDRLQLQEIYVKSGNSAAPNAVADKGMTVRGQVDESLAPITPLAGTTPPAADPKSNSAVPQGLSPAENAAFVEVMSRAAESEVVIIVRPKTAGGQSEVITLDSVSPEFIKALEAKKRSAEASVAR